ncbi:hypothetical protein ACIQ57_01390 [Lysinibacillus xylanilyticus]|uniref:hypothetical protein n=1 Tax=Lysinibacillus xylanilyticus TaxID=582475 RepID=UPI0037FC363C
MNELIIETQQSYNDYLAKLVSGCNEIVGNIQSNNLQQALQLILQFSEGTTWLIDINQKLSTLGYNNELKHEAIQEYFSQINAGLEVQDFVLVSDMFEYEIKPFFENCSLYVISEKN